MLSSVVMLFFAGFKMCIRIVKVNACSACLNCISGL